MQDVRPTRAELLSRRKQISVATQGKNLLEAKLDALMQEFISVVDDAMKLATQLEETIGRAQHGIELARAIDGPSTVHSAALAAKNEVLVEITGHRVMGVPVPVVRQGPEIRRDGFTRGYSPTGVSARVDEAAKKFEAVINTLLQYAEVKTRLRRLGSEITKVNRRVNALEQVRIPQLEQQVRIIEQILDERGREDLFRLKKVKHKIERNKENA